MDYSLVVLTHGDCATLDVAVRSFRERVAPRPVEAFVYADGQHAGNVAYEVLKRYDWTDWTFECAEEPAGFCAAVAACWETIREASTDYVFWLEHDFIFNRPVDLSAMARVLAREPALLQMALRRQPVSEEEIAAGGFVAMRPEAFQQCETFTGDAWIEHELFWTTNPSLFRRQTAVEHAFPTGPQCEGKFGIALRDAIPFSRFGLWGRLTDNPWVRHIGARTGFGY